MSPLKQLERAQWTMMSWACPPLWSHLEKIHISWWTDSPKKKQQLKMMRTQCGWISHVVCLRACVCSWLIYFGGFRGEARGWHRGRPGLDTSHYERCRVPLCVFVIVVGNSMLSSKRDIWNLLIYTVDLITWHSILAFKTPIPWKNTATERVHSDTHTHTR